MDQRRPRAWASGRTEKATHVHGAGRTDQGKRTAECNKQSRHCRDGWRTARSDSSSQQPTPNTRTCDVDLRHVGPRPHLIPVDRRLGCCVVIDTPEPCASTHHTCDAVPQRRLQHELSGMGEALHISTPAFPHFSLSSADGVNASERLLMRLCRRSFLSLWAHANLHTAQDMRDGKGSAKEFADVLVVFGEDVIIFSDKHVQFQHDKPLELAWPRWFKRAVVDSSRQLYGAVSWLRRFPDRVFLDARCTRELPVRLPPPERARYHLVAVTRGSREACERHFPGSLGTLQIRTDVESKAHDTAPFTIGVLDRDKPFVHVLDETSLEVVMAELDTITDFVAYLTDRAKFLTTPELTLAAAGEEQLVAAYIAQGDDAAHPFLPMSLDGQGPATVVFDESHYRALRARTEYQAKRRQDERSRAWDDMIERFIRLGDPQLAFPGVQQSSHDTEVALRLMAAESRFRRCLLVDSLVEMLTAAADEPGRRRARVFTTLEQPDLVYIFLVTPHRQDETHQEYRQHRVALLHAYCRCAKLRFPQAINFVAIGFDHPARVEPMASEDVVVFTCEHYTDEQRIEAEAFQREFGLLGDGFIARTAKAQEFAANAPPPRGGPSEKSALELKKRRMKIAKASKRRNRHWALARMEDG